MKNVVWIKVDLLIACAALTNRLVAAELDTKVEELGNEVVG